MKMLKFLINESENRGSKLISEKEAFDIIPSKCGDALSGALKGKFIYRGVKSPYGFMYVDPKKYTRVSANTTNYYTLINDNSPYWKGYPKRSKSIVCTTDFVYSNLYGNTYVVFPYDGSKIGVCPGRDYWSSFRKQFGYSILPEVMGVLVSIVKSLGVNISDNSYADIKRACKEFDKKYKNGDYKDPKDFIEEKSIVYDDTSKWFSDYDGDLLHLLQVKLSPGINNFSIVKPSNFYNKEIKNKEVWTDGEAILVYASTNMARKLKKRFDIELVTL